MISKSKSPFLQDIPSIILCSFRIPKKHFKILQNFSFFFFFEIVWKQHNIKKAKRLLKESLKYIVKEIDLLEINLRRNIYLLFFS